jgi:hypothetical protein
MSNVNARWLAALVAAVGGVQAVDSGVLGAGPVVQALVVVAIALPVVALSVRAPYGIQALSLVGMGVLLTGARLISPISLNALHVMLVPAAFLILTLSRRESVA